MAADYDGRPVADKRLFDAQARCAKLEAALSELVDEFTADGHLWHPQEATALHKARAALKDGELPISPPS